MKTTHIIIGLMAAGSMIMAGNVTIPNTFTANTTAKAAEVNANFSVVKNAVNDNAADITTNATNISTNSRKIATNETNINNKVSSVTASGGLEASRTGNEVTIKRAGGYISVHSSDFQTI